MMVTTSQTDTPLGDDARAIIAHQFGRWTAYSALRTPGKFIKKKERVLKALDAVDFDSLFEPNRTMTQPKFDKWHREAVAKMRHAIRISNREIFDIGHAAKAIAVYLKTVCYLANYGSDNLRAVIHPPFDRNSMDSLGLEGPVYLDKYSEYEKRVAEARRIAEEKGCSPIELEQFWTPE